MSEQTQRWMKDELQQLLAQRARYVQAESASRDVHQKVRHTTQRLRLDQEILGRREALAALRRQATDSRGRAVDPGLRRPRIAAARSMPTPPRPDRSTSALALGVCFTTFALGFVVVGNLLSLEPRAPNSSPTMVQRYRSLGPATSVRVPKTREERVMAATAPAARHRR